MSSKKNYEEVHVRYFWPSFSGSGELEFEEFCILAARFLIEEDEEQMRRELKEAFRFYDKDGKGSHSSSSSLLINYICDRRGILVDRDLEGNPAGVGAELE